MAIKILTGDCRDVLKTLAEESVQCCVTSPPYFGLRRYLPEGHPDSEMEIGLEQSPDEYVAQMVDVFRGVRRVLRDDGLLWLNLGDSYSSGSGGDKRMGDPSDPKAGGAAAWRSKARAQVVGLAPKQLLGIPWRVAFALQADGWWLRSAIVWHKSNPMPESVQDRPTSAYEMVFMLAKAERYFYDADAVAETATGRDPGNVGHAYAEMGGTKAGLAKIKATDTRNARNVWTIATQPYSEAHFATMAPNLAERCIKAGSRPGDTILDPFSGAGTTALVADRLQRNAIGIELNPKYGALARERITADAGLFGEVA